MIETSKFQAANRKAMMPAQGRFPMPLVLLFIWVINVGLYLWYFSAFGMPRLQQLLGN